MPASARRPQPAPAKYFVIEDDPDHQKIAQMTLQSMGVEDATFFDTGEDAMDYFEESDPDPEVKERIILIDLMLPRISGFEILRKLRKDERWGSSTMVVLTCSTSPEDRARSEEYGADAFFSKPLRIEYLRKISSSDR